MKTDSHGGQNGLYASGLDGVVVIYDLHCYQMLLLHWDAKSAWPNFKKALKPQMMYDSVSEYYASIAVH